MWKRSGPGCAPGVRHRLVREANRLFLPLSDTINRNGSRCGHLAVRDVDTGLVMKALEPIWQSKTETAGRVRERIEVVLDAAKARGWREGENPARWRGHLENLLPRPFSFRKVKHHKALPFADMGSYMATLRQQGGIRTREEPAIVSHNTQLSVIAAQHPSKSTGLSHCAERACTRYANESALQGEPINTAEEIGSLKWVDIEALRLRWRTVFRKPFPHHLPRYLTAYLLAYRIQALLHGDLSPEEARYLADAGKSDTPQEPTRFGAGKSRHRQGTKFAREYDGILHCVMKTGRGFEWNGREFKSLSAVAFAITGTKWNGPRFFGVLPPRRDRGD